VSVVVALCLIIRLFPWLLYRGRNMLLTICESVWCCFVRSPDDSSYEDHAYDCEDDDTNSSVVKCIDLTVFEYSESKRAAMMTADTQSGPTSSTDNSSADTCSTCGSNRDSATSSCATDPSSITPPTSPHPYSTDAKSNRSNTDARQEPLPPRAPPPLPPCKPSSGGSVTSSFSLTGNEVCCVCLCEYEEGEICARTSNRDTGCRHVWHKSCIENWIKEGHWSCPICRASLLSSSSHSPPHCSPRHESPPVGPLQMAVGPSSRSTAMTPPLLQSILRPHARAVTAGAGSAIPAAAAAAAASSDGSPSEMENECIDIESVEDSDVDEDDVS